MLALIASLPVAVLAQRPEPVTAAPGRPPARECAAALASDQCSVAPGLTSPVQGRAASAWPVAASALLPGLGQAVQGVDRAVAYLAVEVFAWAGYAWYSTDSRRLRDGYRELSARVARSRFTPVRPHGDFTYYERMSDYPEAGRYDVIAGGGIDPEPDSTTWNGAVWALARRTYWSDPGMMPDPESPEWQRSIAFYQARAYDQLYRWSWSGAPDEYGQFRDLIDGSNDANRRSLQALGLVIANHVLSTVDAYIVVRLRGQGVGGDGGFGIEGSLPIGSLARQRSTPIVSGIPGTSRRR